MSYNKQTNTWTVGAYSSLSHVLSFTSDSFPSCCQAYILHNLGKPMAIPRGAKVVFVNPKSVLEEEEMDGYALYAVTTSEQDHAEQVLEALGFTKVHQWYAKTGSYLTSWLYKPEDQDAEEDDDGYNDEDEGGVY